MQVLLVALLQVFLGLLQAGSYIFLVFWSFNLVKDLPPEKYFKKVRFYHLLVPALALASLAFVPVKFALDLLFSFPFDFSQAWLPPLLRFLEGVAFLGLIIFLSQKFKAAGEEK